MTQYKFPCAICPAEYKSVPDIWEHAQEVHYARGIVAPNARTDNMIRLMQKHQTHLCQGRLEERK